VNKVLIIALIVGLSISLIAGTHLHTQAIIDSETSTKDYQMYFNFNSSEDLKMYYEFTDPDTGVEFDSSKNHQICDDPQFVFCSFALTVTMYVKDIDKGSIERDTNKHGVVSFTEEEVAEKVERKSSDKVKFRTQGELFYTLDSDGIERQVTFKKLTWEIKDDRLNATYDICDNGEDLVIKQKDWDDYKDQSNVIKEVCKEEVKICTQSYGDLTVANWELENNEPYKKGSCDKVCSGSTAPTWCRYSAPGGD